MSSLLAKALRKMQVSGEQSGQPLTMPASGCGVIAERLELLDLIERMSECGTVDSFMATSDEHKRLWFALAVADSSRRKTAEAHLAEAREIIEECYPNECGDHIGRWLERRTAWLGVKP